MLHYFCPDHYYISYNPFTSIKPLWIEETHYSGYLTCGIIRSDICRKSIIVWRGKVADTGEIEIMLNESGFLAGYQCMRDG
jgi:hypothetical protein